VVQWDCGTGENQRWYFRALVGGNYQLSAEHSAKCLRTKGGSTGSGAAFVQDPCARGGAGMNGTVVHGRPRSAAATTSSSRSRTAASACSRPTAPAARR
jgi:hypothetical protein